MLSGIHTFWGNHFHFKSPSINSSPISCHDTFMLSHVNRLDFNTIYCISTKSRMSETESLQCLCLSSFKSTVLATFSNRRGRTVAMQK